MATAVVVMDRPSFRENTDVIVVADPAQQRLLWVPRDVWCEPIRHRINRAYANHGGHPGLVAGLAALGIGIEHSVCLQPAAIAAGIEGLEVTVQVKRELAFWYPLEPQRDIEEGRKQIRFRPPAETLSGERIHQWIGARYPVEGSSSDLDRIRRQRRLVAALLRERFDFRRFLTVDAAVEMSSEAALAELAAVDGEWRLETLGGLVGATIDEKMVLVQEGR